MALIERQVVITTQDDQGNQYIEMPVTKVDYVEGAVSEEEVDQKLSEMDKGGMPVGHIYFSLEKTVPTGSLPLNGGTYTHLAYIDLWNYILERGNYLTFDEWQAMYDANDGNVPFYAVAQSGSQSQWRFRVPSINGWIKGASSLDEVGSYLEAGLPNITGEVLATANVNAYENAIEDSAVFGTNQASRKTIRESSASYDLYSTLGFDASRSNNIYGASDTVQPPSIVGMWLVKAFGTVSNVGNQDIAEVSVGLTRVENKMDEYTDNVTYIDAFLIETWKSDDGMTWYRKYSDGFIEQGGAIRCGTGYQSVTVTLPTAFTTTTYTAMSVATNTAKLGDGTDLISGKTTTAFTTHTHYKGDTLPTWYACGY